MCENTNQMPLNRSDHRNPQASGHIHRTQAAWDEQVHHLLLQNVRCVDESTRREYRPILGDIAGALRVSGKSRCRTRVPRPTIASPLPASPHLTLRLEYPAHLDGRDKKTALF
jgi:hypothetical protein